MSGQTDNLSNTPTTSWIRTAIYTVGNTSCDWSLYVEVTYRVWGSDLGNGMFGTWKVAQKFVHGKMQRMRRLWQCFSCKSNSSLSLIFDAWQPYSKKLHSRGKSLITFSHNKFLFEVEKFKGARHIGQVAILGIRHLLHKICPLLHWCTIDLGLGIEQQTGHSRRV